MNTTVPVNLPRDLIQNLFDSDRRSQDGPALSANDRPEAQRWLSRILVDFEALDEHIALLQTLYKAPFRYPRPRRDCWSIEQLNPAAETPQFAYAGRLADDVVTAIADRGVGADVLDDALLSRLLLNPFALYDLFDVIDELQPEHWMTDLQDLATAAMSAEHTTGSEKPSATMPDTQTNPASPTRQTVNPADEFWNRLQERLVEALRQSQYASPGSSTRSVAADGEVAEHTARRRTRNREFVAATVFACAATLLIGIFVGLAWNKGNGKKPFEVLVASTKVQASNSRGDGPQSKVLLIESRHKGFASVIALFSDEQPLVPCVDLPIVSGVPMASPPLSQGLDAAVVALVVITEQPAGRFIEDLLHGQMFRPDQLDQLQTFLIDKLAANNYQWIAFSRAPLRSSSSQ